MVFFKDKYGKISECWTLSYSETVSGENFLSVTVGSLLTLCTRSAKRTTLEFFHFVEALQDCTFRINMFWISKINMEKYRTAGRLIILSLVTS